MKKVIELVILPEDQESGVSAISLVDRPAIEVNFMYFKKDGDDTYFKKEEEPKIEPFDDPEPIEKVYTAYEIETIVELAKTLGVPSDVVQVSKETFSKKEEFKDGDVVYLYKYSSSGVAGNSRSFCQAMMGIGRYYTKDEILILDDLNNEFGPGVGGGRYNVFKYKGGSNCQHYWDKYRAVEYNGSYFVTLVNPETHDELIAATAPRTFQGRGFVKRPERNLPPLSGHSAFKFKLDDDEDKHILVSPIMIPNMDIVRLDEVGEEYFVKFSPETILEISQKFMKEARTNDTNIDHTERIDAGTYLFESWIIETPDDKMNTKYGFDLPIGTWCGCFKVEDMKVWDMVKSGKLNGVSVEGLFLEAEELDNMRKYERIRQLIQEAEPEELDTFGFA